MKTAATLLLLALAALPAQAQIFRPAAVNGAVLGGLAGAIIGNNSGGHNGARGALIGALAGGLLGSAADEPHGYAPGAVWSGYPSAPVARFDGFAGPVVFGGVAGAIIGHNNGRRNGWRGAAIGAEAGWLLSWLAEDRVVRETSLAPAVVYASAPFVSVPAPAPVTIINNYYSGPATPMGPANALFGR